MDHSDLVAEFPVIEKMTPAERIQLARERRALQLLKWSDMDKLGNKGDPVKTTKVIFGAEIALLEATARNDSSEVRRILAEGANPNSHNEDGLTPLHQCAIDNNQDIMLVLIEHGASVNSQDTEQWSPLHAAACCAHIDIVRILIQNGANLLAVNADGNMPYDICDDDATLDLIESEMARKGITQDDIDEERGSGEKTMLDDMKWLHQQGLPLDYRDDDGATPLHVAAANGYYDVAAFVMRCGVSPNVRDNDLWQPVHAAACWAQPDLIELLSEYGADVTSKTNSGETTMDLCEDETTRAVIATLQAEAQRKRRVAFGARDSRRQSRKKKATSKFESPQQLGVVVSDSPFSARGAIRRLSLRDRSGMTLARLEAHKEHSDLMRSFSMEDTSIQGLLEKKDSGGQNQKHKTEIYVDGEPLPDQSLKEENGEEVSTSDVRIDGKRKDSPTKKNRSKQVRGRSGSAGSGSASTMSPDEWLKKLEEEGGEPEGSAENEPAISDRTKGARAGKRRGKKKAPTSPSDGSSGSSESRSDSRRNGAPNSDINRSESPKHRFRAPKDTVVGPSPRRTKRLRCKKCCVIS